MTDGLELIARLEREIELRQTALGALRELYQPALPLARRVAKKRNGRSTPIASGSLPDRLLGALKTAGEPTRVSVLIADAGAREADVRSALSELVADARVVRTGKTASVRYSLP
jgi:hypothetical protein